MLAGRSPATRRVGVWRVGGELFCALDFTFLQGTFLQGEVSLLPPTDPCCSGLDTAG